MHKIPNVSYLSFKAPRSFGVELEMNNLIDSKVLAQAVSKADPNHQVITSTAYSQDYNNNYWHVKFDRSCGDVKNVGGREVASYVAKGPKDLINIGNVANALRQAGAVVNNDCGLHVHVGIADFKPEQVASLTANWMKIEPLICEILPKHRRTNKYARLLTHKHKIVVGKAYAPLEFLQMVLPRSFGNPSRRVSFNLCNYVQQSRKTVELRLPEGTLDEKQVKNWVRFFVHFVDMAKHRAFPSDLRPVGLYEGMKIIGLHGDDPFLILSKGLRETKIWFMRRILTYSAKRKTREEADSFLNVLLRKRAKKKPIEIPLQPEILKIKTPWNDWNYQGEDDFYENFGNF